MKHITILSAVAIGFCATVVAEPDLKQSAAKVFADQQDHTVSLIVTRKTARKDVTFTTTALCLNREGLIVASLSTMNNNDQAKIATVTMTCPGEGEEGPGELTRVALIAPDGAEVEGELVLQDHDLDLAFIQLKKQQEGKDARSLPSPPSPAGRKAVLLDDLVSINRHGPDFQRVGTCSLVEVASVIDTPQELYIPSSRLQGSSAVYNLDGGLVGLVTTVKGLPVIVPYHSIMKLAEGIKTGEE